jgi:hypothetical protein
VESYLADVEDCPQLREATAGEEEAERRPPLPRRLTGYSRGMEDCPQLHEAAAGAEEVECLGRTGSPARAEVEHHSARVH